MAIESSLTIAAVMDHQPKPPMVMTWTPTLRMRRLSPMRSVWTNAVHIGHSTGGGEVARYVARYSKGRVAKAVLVSAVPPLMLKADRNPVGTPLSVFDGFRAQLAANRAQFFREVPIPFYGFNRPGAKILDEVVDNCWRQGMMGDANAHYLGIKAFSETDGG